jgi:hypothetical protein
VPIDRWRKRQTIREQNMGEMGVHMQESNVKVPSESLHQHTFCELTFGITVGTSTNTPSTTLSTTLCIGH